MTLKDCFVAEPPSEQVELSRLEIRVEIPYVNIRYHKQAK